MRHNLDKLTKYNEQWVAINTKFLVLSHWYYIQPLNLKQATRWQVSTQAVLEVPLKDTQYLHLLSPSEVSCKEELA